MKSVIALLCIVATFSAIGQTTYSVDRAKFLKEFQSALSVVGKGEETDFVKKDLTKMLLETKEMPDRYFTTMVNTCNELVAKRFNTHPDVYNYVFSVYSIVKNKKPEATFDAFQGTITKLLQSKNPKRFTEFAASAQSFFYNGALATKPNFEWFYEGGTFEFKYNDKPIIELQGGNLICRYLYSSSEIKGRDKYVDSVLVTTTNGIYDPVTERFQGKGGTITWEKVGISKTETYAELNNYQVSMKNSSLNADTVMVKSPYFKEKLMGSLSERAFKTTREQDNIYPQFISYKTDLKITNIKPNVNYEGAFAMRGPQFIGTGVNNSKAIVTLIRNNKPFIVARATEITINNEKIFINGGMTTVHLSNTDSLYHPSINFNYYFEKSTLEMSRMSTGLGQAPFYSSFHKLDLYVPKIILSEKDQLMTFTYEVGTSQEQRIANFESVNYFDIKLYNYYQGLANVNPLQAISKYAYKYDKYIITEGECATALGGTIESVRPIMLQMANQGFITYDVENKKVVVNQKLENFVNSFAGKQDYDNIIFTCDFRPKSLKGYSDEEIKNDKNLQQIQANYKKINDQRRVLDRFGSMDMKTLDISLIGIDQVTLSHKQNTHIYPKDNLLTIKKNRDIEFAGWLNAGKIEMNILVGNYVYDENKVNLLKTEQTLLRVSPRDPAHGKSGIIMNSHISEVVGDILVDLPTNRSGNKENAETAKFPFLTIKNTTKVYYNHPELYRGAYDSTRFYYSISPFTIDSLDNFNDRTFRLNGELNSAGIFPIIKEDLKVMPDYSFGFSTSAPKGGLNFYGTGANYENKIMLSGSGLQGAGTINFVKSTSVSKNLFTFLPDSTMGIVKFTNTGVGSGIEFPEATCEEAQMVYLPRKKVLKAYSTSNNDIRFFGAQADLAGTATVTPEGMVGEGLMTFKTASIMSKKFVYKHQDIFADTSSFSLKNQNREEGEAQMAFETKNVRADVSFKDRKGIFYSNSGETEVSFPVNQYRCKMDQFTWLMDMDEIDLEKGKEAQNDLAIDNGVGAVGSNFFSTHPKQDTLQFLAPKAKFDLKQKTLFCDLVEYMDIADARIYPDSQKVTIRRKAAMDQLQNATIVANYITKYHKFIRSTVNVTGRRAYTGLGEFPYYDKDSNVTYVLMDAIGLDQSLQTIATGKISKEKAFKLSSEFEYYGSMTVKAASPEIMFEGATKINHNCVSFEQNWLAFSSYIDPMNVQIPVSTTMKNLDGEPVSAGIVWRDDKVVDSITIYPTFLSSLVNANDPIMFTSSGVLTYVEEKSEFQIASKEKILNRTAAGNFLAMNTKTCSLYGEGEVKLGMDHGDVKITSIGTVEYNQKSGETSMNLTSKIDMALDKNIFKTIADKINAETDLNPSDFFTNTLKMAVTTWANQGEADKLEEDFMLKGELKKLPSSLESTFTFTGLRLKFYNQPSLNNFKGLITSVESAVLVSVYDKPVMKYVPLRAFFQQKYSGAGGDWFAFAIDVPGSKSYFFNYSAGKKEGVMDIMSSDPDITSAVQGQKEDKRRTKNFLYQIGQGGLRTVFNNLFVK